MEAIPTGREPRAIIMPENQKTRLRLRDLTSYLKEVQYPEIRFGAGGVKLSDDGGGSSVQEGWTG